MVDHKLRVALLAGGKSGEREVSLSGGKQASQALDPKKYDVRFYDPAFDLGLLIEEAPRLDVALIFLHGRFGEDGTLQGLLDLVGLRYQGSGVMSSAICMDKRATKDLYRHHGLLVPRDILLDRNRPKPFGDIIEAMGLPVVVKPASEGSSLGMSIPKTEAELAAGVEDAFRYDRWVLVEEYIKGREITSSILGNDTLEALPLIEITPGCEYPFFNYDAKYQPGASEEVCPAPLSEPLTRQAQEIGLTAHRILFCRGYSRTDMILSEADGRFYVLETNTIPGMTQTSLFPRAARTAGYSFGALLDRLLELALE